MIILMVITGNCSNSTDPEDDADSEELSQPSEPGPTSVATSGSSAPDTDSGCVSSNLGDPAMWPGQAEPVTVSLPLGPTVDGTEGLGSSLDSLGIPFSGDDPVSEGPSCSVSVGEPPHATIYLQLVSSTYRVVSAFQPEPGIAWGYEATGGSIRVDLSADLCVGESSCEADVAVRFGDVQATDSTSIDVRGADVTLSVQRDDTTPGTILIHGTDGAGNVLSTVGTQLPAGDSAAG